MLSANWSFHQRLTIEIAIVTVVLGMLVLFAVKILQAFIRTTYLVEPVYMVLGLRAHMMIDSVLTGIWPDESSILMDSDEYADTVHSFHISDQGNINVLLGTHYPELNGQAFGFNLGVLDSGDGYISYSWRCGSAEAPNSYQVKEPFVSSVSILYSHTVCRW